MGVWAQVVYPNILGFGGQRAAKVDPALRLACVQIYNDAMAEMQVESGYRIFPMALLPWWDVEDAVIETERCANIGLRGININSDPQAHKDAHGVSLRDLAHPYWDPLWEICTAREMPVNFHIGGSEQSIAWFGDQGWPSLATDMHAALGGAMLFFNNGRVMANIICSGLLDRFPHLKFVSVESGIGWIPMLLEALDHQYKEITIGGTLQKLPSEYFKSNIYACFWFEARNLAHSIRTAGVDNVMFETDFPHPTCLYPVNEQTYAMPDLTPEEREKVLSANASKVYHIPVG
jgi:predicted TIM-barrel fold metal-dependent hydrolase